jgi:outer membrane protein OmpA-like peptidoglycan-associated protein
MRLLLWLLVTFGILAGASDCLAETALFKSFFEQRELVATIPFDRGSSKLGQPAVSELESALDRIRGAACEARLIRIEGFAGSEGAAEQNFRLSLNRAYSVSRFLEGKGVPCLIGMNGYGDLRAGQDTALNDLRVEIAAYPKMFLFDFEAARYVDEVKRP